MKRLSPTFVAEPPFSVQPFGGSDFHVCDKRGRTVKVYKSRQGGGKGGHAAYLKRVAEADCRQRNAEAGA